MNGILLSCEVENISTRRDKTFKIVFGTMELTPSNGAELLGLMNQMVALYISPKEMNQNEIDKVDKLNPEFGTKTQSQRLRNVLYKLSEQNLEGFKTFDDYYHGKMELIIEHYKKKIEP